MFYWDRLKKKRYGPKLAWRIDYADHCVILYNSLVANKAVIKKLSSVVIQAFKLFFFMSAAFAQLKALSNASYKQTN